MMAAKDLSDRTGSRFRENWYSILLATMGELEAKKRTNTILRRGA